MTQSLVVKLLYRARMPLNNISLSRIRILNLEEVMNLLAKLSRSKSSMQLQLRIPVASQSPVRVRLPITSPSTLV